MKKINWCPGKGYVEFQKLLATGKQIECEVCKEAMEECGFDAEELKNEVESALAGDKAAPAEGNVGNPEQSDGPPAAKKRRRGPRSEVQDVWKREEDARAAAKVFEPHLVLLPLGSHNKKVPYRCLICTSVKQPEGKVGECKQMTPGSVRHFMQQHVDSEGHERSLRSGGGCIQEHPRNSVPCEAIDLAHPMEGSILHVHKAEFRLWASFANLEASAKHEYWKDANTASWHVRSHSCKKTVEENQNKSRQVCDECFKLTKSKSIVRMPLRFAKQFHAAELLNAKVFEGDEVVETVMKAIKASNLYQRDKANMDQLLALGTGQLQQFVRTSFLSEHSISTEMQKWQHMVVKPCLRVNVAAIPEQFRRIAPQFEFLMASGVSDDDVARLKAGLMMFMGDFHMFSLFCSTTICCLHFVASQYVFSIL